MAMRCEICHGSPLAGVTLFRVNETGIAGRWRCRTHLDQPPDPALLQMVEDLETGDPSHHPEETTA